MIHISLCDPQFFPNGKRYKRYITIDWPESEGWLVWWDPCLHWKWHNVSVREHPGSQVNATLPAFFMGKSVFLCIVEGNSLMRRDSWRLKGDIFWLRAGNPRKEPWRASCSMGACLRGMAWGLLTSREPAASEVGEVGEEEGGAEWPGAADEPATVLSVSAQESQEKEDFSNVFN